ncbi:MAG: hypothetical protein HPY67_13955 [Syntrophaceae bacterium]|nr:hypothetical protein [Syntrophaceae bacterium]
MERNERNAGQELRILTHEPVEGWRPVFFALVAVSVVYLALILALTL